MLLIGFVVFVILFFINSFIATNLFISGSYDSYGSLPIPPWVKKYIENKVAEPTLKFNEIKFSLPYQSIKNYNINNIHIGQRKLFLTELQHLINVDNTDKPFVVVYAGAAASVHSGFLLELFPQMKWLGIDPNEFSLNMLRKSQSSESKIRNIDEYSDNHYAYPEKSVYLYPSDRDMYPTSCEKNMQIYDFETKTVTLQIRNQIAKLEEKQQIANENMGEIAKIINDREERIYFWENVMSNELAENLRKLHDYFPLVLFWSDIRTTIVRNKNFTLRKYGEQEKTMTNKSGQISNFEETGEENGPTNLDILWNSAQQFNWVNALKPQNSMLKFRPYFLPLNANMEKDWQLHLGENVNFADYDFIQKELDVAKNEIDFLEDYKKGYLKYYDGDIYLQPFAGPTSCETRLHIAGNNIKTTIYGPQGFEEKMFWYNTVDRPFIFHENSNSDPDIGFDHCNDCAIENNIWKAFIAKYKKEKPVLYFVKRLTVATNERTLLQKNHGKFFENKL